MEEVMERRKGKKRRRACRICGSKIAVMQRYNLNMCRRCFKEIAENLGFKKYD